MWLVICRENNEDPVFMSLVPFNTMYASRLSILVFHDKGAEGVERLAVGRSGPGGLYKSVWDPANPTNGRGWPRSSRNEIPSGSGSTRARRSTTATACRPR